MNSAGLNSGGVPGPQDMIGSDLTGMSSTSSGLTSTTNSVAAADVLAAAAAAASVTADEAANAVSYMLLLHMIIFQFK